MAIGTGLGLVLGALASAGTQAVLANQAKQDAKGALGNVPQLNPAQIGQQSLDAQAALAPQQLALEQQYRPQFQNVGNWGAYQGLFGTTPPPSITENANFAALPPDVQGYLQQLMGTQGAGAVTQQFASGTPYENLLGMYQGMGLGPQGGEWTDADRDAFNQWTIDSGFEGWGQGQGLSQTLGNWAQETSQAPGLVDTLSKAHRELNPQVFSGLDRINTAAQQAPATVNAPGVNQSAAAGQLQSLFGQPTPQVQGPGANPGMDALSSILGTSGYSPVNAASVGAPQGANTAGGATFAATPNAPQAQQATFNQAASPGNVSAPTSFQSVSAQQVQAPGGYQQVQAPGSVQQVQAPGAVGNVTGPSSFERVNAPSGVANVNAPGSVSVGQNQTLQDLQAQGFNANRPIQQTLEQQALADLSLGNQMNADQIRAAQQASRAAANARGMAAANPAMLEEMQRQFNVSNQLQNERRAFASGVENQGFGQLATQQGLGLQAAGLQNQYLGLGLQADQTNAANQLQAALANQQSGLTTQGQGLQAQMANQAAGLDLSRLGLQGQMANQQTQLAQSNQGLQAQMANQGADLDLARLGLAAQQSNQQAGLTQNAQGLQAALANQGANLQAGLANQAAGLDLSRLGLQANLANQSTAAAMNQFNAGQANQLGQFNAGQANDLNALMAQLGLQAGQFNAGQANQMAQFNAGQQDTAAARALQAGTTNAQLAQQAALANQGAQQQDWAQRLAGTSDLANLFNTQQAMSQQADQANQAAWLQQLGLNSNALQGIMGADNQLNMFNAANDLTAQQFNANQQQQGFQNLLAAQQANQATALDPAIALQLANAQAQPQFFNPFDPAIMAMYAANAQNQVGSNIAGANNSAAVNAGLMQGIGSLVGGGLNAYAAYKN